MKIEYVVCNHEWEEGICVNCGTEYAPVQQSRFELFASTPAGKKLLNAEKSKPVLRFNSLTGYKHPSLTAFLAHAFRAVRQVGFRCLTWTNFYRHIPGYTPVKPVAFLLLFALLYPIEAFPGFMAVAEPVQPKPAKIARDTDSRFPQKRQIIAKSDGKIVITFSNCRENNLHHVSCQFKTPDGELRWLYLPGYTLPPE
jgi:hypothetical protein